jgi:hypothetical protein
MFMRVIFSSPVVKTNRSYFSDRYDERPRSKGMGGKTGKKRRGVVDGKTTP